MEVSPTFRRIFGDALGKIPRLIGATSANSYLCTLESVMVGDLNSACDRPRNIEGFFGQTNIGDVSGA